MHEQNQLQLNGVFPDVQVKLATKILNTVQQIIFDNKLDLPQNDVQSCSKDPAKFLIYLEGCKKTHSPSSVESINQLKQCVNSYQEINSLLSNANKHIILNPFLFSPEYCIPYFRYNYYYEKEFNELNQFNELLGDVKIKGLDPETGPNNEYIRIKNKILEAMKPNDIFKDDNNDNTNFKRVFHRYQLVMNPDKNIESYKEESTMLFLVIMAAWNCIKTTSSN